MLFFTASGNNIEDFPYMCNIIEILESISVLTLRTLLFLMTLCVRMHVSICVYIHTHICKFWISFILSNGFCQRFFFFNKSETANFYLKPPSLIECEFSNNFFPCLPKRTDKISKSTIS